MFEYEICKVEMFSLKLYTRIVSCYPYSTIKIAKKQHVSIILVGTLPFQLKTIATVDGRELTVMAGNNRTTYIGLSGKSLSGELPLLKMDELIHFIVHNNALSGTIPSMDGLSKLEYLSLFNNQFTGTLPQITLPRLQSCYLTDNELDVVPDLTSTCPNLTFYFYIARNRGDLTVHQNMCNAFPDDHISVLTNSGSLTCASF